MTFEQFQQETSGENALEQVLQDRAEQLRKELTEQTGAPAADAPAADAPAPAAQ
ncbi:hypothetical protein D3C86_2163890 [compost metagenome]